MVEALKAAARWFAGVFAWLQDHEAVRFGFAVQVVITAATGWLLAQANRLHLPGELAEVVVSLAGLYALGKVNEWKRSRVASAATAARLLLERTPPAEPAPPIPLAEVAHEDRVSGRP